MKNISFNTNILTIYNVDKVIVEQFYSIKKLAKVKIWSTTLSTLRYSNLLMNSIIGTNEVSTVSYCWASLHLLPDFIEVGSVRRMLMVSEGMSVVHSGTHHSSLAAYYMACPDGRVV